MILKTNHSFADPHPSLQHATMSESKDEMCPCGTMDTVTGAKAPVAGIRREEVEISSGEGGSGGGRLCSTLLHSLYIERPLPLYSRPCGQRRRMYVTQDADHFT